MVHWSRCFTKRYAATFAGIAVRLHAYLTSVLDEGEWSVSRLGRFTCGVRDIGTHWMEDWVDLRNVLKALEKRNASCHLQESNLGSLIVNP
jgi:hypothetical protein